MGEPYIWQIKWKSSPRLSASKIPSMPGLAIAEKLFEFAIVSEDQFISFRSRQKSGNTRIPSGC
jgi:hypothetical protein